MHINHSLRFNSNGVATWRFSPAMLNQKFQIRLINYAVLSACEGQVSHSQLPCCFLGLLEFGCLDADRVGKEGIPPSAVDCCCVSARERLGCITCPLDARPRSRFRNSKQPPCVCCPSEMQPASFGVRFFLIPCPAVADAGAGGRVIPLPSGPQMRLMLMTAELRWGTAWRTRCRAGTGFGSLCAGKCWCSGPSLFPGQF